MLFAITVHEAAHGYVARYFGDNTATMMGRVTLNPFKHIDPIGTILMPLLLYFATLGAFLFGYAKPVPVNFGQLRHPKRDWCGSRWPGRRPTSSRRSCGRSLFTLLVGMGLRERFFLEMCKAGVLVNLVMWAFNLFPLPPLDGGRVAGRPAAAQAVLCLQRASSRAGFFIVMALVVAGVVSSYWLGP